jgi:hypothetical protein
MKCTYTWVGIAAHASDEQVTFERQHQLFEQAGMFTKNVIYWRGKSKQKLEKVVYCLSS